MGIRFISLRSKRFAKHNWTSESNSFVNIFNEAKKGVRAKRITLYTRCTAEAVMEVAFDLAFTVFELKTRYSLIHIIIDTLQFGHNKISMIAANATKKPLLVEDKFRMRNTFYIECLR